MSNDFTQDDALTEPVEAKTQDSVTAKSREQYNSDATQQLSHSPPLQNTPEYATRIPESAVAQIVEDDLDEADTRFRKIVTVAEDFGAFEDKAKGNNKRMKRSKTKKSGRVLRWKAISAEKMKKRKVERIILDGVSGHARAGELTFIMGSSGAGKTTLLNILTGRNQSKLVTTGEVTLNGRSMTPVEMKRISAYVQQEDVFIGSQTVSEVLHFAVKMRSPDVLSREKREKLVQEMLVTFNLKQCENTKIGNLKQKGISRGEKKRLAFACEILTDPPVLFCDEPTSGLDSFMSHQVMKCLKTLAEEGKIIVCTIHQPSTWVYQMADRLILLCQGRVAFDGSTQNVDGFLERIGAPTPQFASVSDHFIRILSRGVTEKQKDYERRIEVSIVFGTAYIDFLADPGPSEEHRVPVEVSIFEFFALVRRGFVQISRRKKYIVARLILTVLVSWFLGMVYLRIPIHKDNLLAIKGVIFATLQMNNILYMMPSLISFWEDYPVVVREYQSNMYSPSAYFMARSFTDSILHLFFPLIFFVIIYFMTGLPVTAIGISTFLTMSVAMSMIITSLSHAVVSLCGNVTMSLTVAPLISVPVMVFGGFLITVDAVPWYYKPLSYISWYHYAFEAIMIAFFKDVGHIKGCNQSVNPQFDIECSTGLKLIHDQDFHVDHFWIDFVAVAGILIFWKLFGLFAFIFRIRKIKS